MGTVTYNLGGVALPYADFSWPKYRGTVARIVTIDAPGEMYADFAKLARGLSGKPTYLEVTGPAEAGTNPAKATVKIEGVYIQRVTKLNKQVCQLQLADARILLARRVGDKDFRLLFGDGYLEGTDEPTVKSATEALVLSIDVLRGNVGGGAYQEFPVVDTREKTYISGSLLSTSLAELLDQANVDLTVKNDGRFAFAAREDLAGAAKLPAVSKYDWAVEPTWTAADSLVLGVPRKIVGYYPERHCLRIEGTDENSTASTHGPAELKVQWEQVYSSEGKIYTLAELLVANNFGATDLTDAKIAKCFWTDNFEGTPLAASFGTAQFGRVHTAVRNDWRRLWRLEFADAKGHLGGWTDLAPGKINADGSASPVAVECPWVEFLAELAVPDGQPLIGSPMTINHTDTAPFGIMWEGGPESGIIRLVQKDNLRGGVAIPGALIEPLVIEKRLTSSVESGSGEAFSVGAEYFVVERQDIGKARFSPSFRMATFICATRRLPNDETRWHAEQTTGDTGGDIERIELPLSGELYCVRDYVNINEANHAPLGDLLGPILNQQDLTDDIEVRGEAWMVEHVAALDGFGVAESVMLFNDVEVRGPINEISLEFRNDGLVQTRITAGNLGDNDQRRRKAAKRLADRKFAAMGAQ